jgi:hypothetical protein
MNLRHTHPDPPRWPAGQAGEIAEAGGLMSYADDYETLNEHAAGNHAYWPSAQRYSTTTFWPST